MKLPIEINGKTVEITLTKEQIAVVKKSQQTITERIKTEEDIWREAGIRDYEWEDMHIFDQIALLVKVLNEGWVPDWNNGSQYKYEPYFKWDGNRFVFDYSGSWGQFASVGARLCFKSSDLAKYAGTQFVNLYNKLLSL